MEELAGTPKSIKGECDDTSGDHPVQNETFGVASTTDIGMEQNQPLVNEKTESVPLVSASPPHDGLEAAGSTCVPSASSIPVGGPLSNEDAILGKPSSFAKFVRTWESYMSDGAVDQLEPLQMFQQLHLCNAEEGFQRIGDSSEPDTQGDNNNMLDPISLRHTHSSPLRHTPSMLDDDAVEPPPLQTDSLSRSRSTPLSTSANSAFGTILRTMPYLRGPDDRSAFTLPTKLCNSASNDFSRSRCMTFNPIADGNEIEEIDPTTIEVMDLNPRRHKEVIVTQDLPKKETAPLAARFLSDVRGLSRRVCARGGRENPARPASSSDESRKKADVADEETLSSKSSTKNEFSSSSPSESKSPDYSKRFGVRLLSDKTTSTECVHEEKVEETNIPAYYKLKSDTDDECNQFQRVENNFDGNSPSSIPSPTYYQSALDDRPGSRVDRIGVRIQVSSSAKSSLGVSDVLPSSTGSPSFTEVQMLRDGSNITLQSQDSPGASHTSGHTTLATSTTVSSGQVSHLSSISETDREVMEATKVGKSRRNQRGLPTISRNDTEGPTSHSSSNGSTNALSYLAISNSPLREGANFPADRFFIFGEQQALGRLRSSSSQKKSTSNSPMTVSSSSMNTNSTSSSNSDEPPMFVSYLDRKTTSDLKSLREDSETSSPRVNGEERESPSQIVGYAELVFEEAKAPRKTNSKYPRPVRPTKGRFFGRRFRCLPPRSPAKGTRTPTTPPPRASNDSESTAYNSLSPPRNIVDHRIEPNVSRPFVLRSTPHVSTLNTVSGVKVLLVSPEHLSSANMVNTSYMGVESLDDAEQEVGHEIIQGSSIVDACSDNHYNVMGELHGVEILRADSKDERSSISLVNPENHTDDA